MTQSKEPEMHWEKAILPGAMTHTHKLPQRPRTGTTSCWFQNLQTVQATVRKHLWKTRQDIALKN